MTLSPSLWTIQTDLIEDLHADLKGNHVSATVTSTNQYDSSIRNQPTPLPNSHTATRVPSWKRFSLPQMAVIAAALVAPLVLVATIFSRILGLIDTETMIEICLNAGENPGMITFGAMFICSPIQWITGRSQVRVRKFLGIVFFVLAASNFLMFILERGIGQSLSSPLLVAGTAAIAISLPLFLTSSRKSQRKLGMKRWRLLHRATYLVAFALLLHVILVPDFGPGALAIVLGFIARIPGIRQRITRPPRRARASATPAPA